MKIHREINIANKQGNKKGNKKTNSDTELDREINVEISIGKLQGTHITKII